MRRLHLTREEFEECRFEGVLRVDTVYCLDDEESFAVSPDGVGAYWYDSLEEAIEENE
jgi:hypothetical protein